VDPGSSNIPGIEEVDRQVNKIDVGCGDISETLQAERWHSVLVVWEGEGSLAVATMKGRTVSIGYRAIPV
jgi:hypothetical protein